MSEIKDASNEKAVDEKRVTIAVIDEKNIDDKVVNENINENNDDIIEEKDTKSSSDSSEHLNKIHLKTRPKAKDLELNKVNK